MSILYPFAKFTLQKVCPKAQLLKSALCDVIKGTGTSPRLLPHPQLGVGDDIYEICELFLGGLVLFVHDCFMRLQVENYRC